MSPLNKKKKAKQNRHILGQMTQGAQLFFLYGITA